MTGATTHVTDRQVLRGLSNGVVVCAVAGAAWLGFGCAHAEVATTPSEWKLALGSCVLIPAALFWAALRLRRRSPTTLAALTTEAGGRPRTEIRRLRVGFLWVTLIEVVLIFAAVRLCLAFDRYDLLSAAVGLAVSLHFIPVGLLFRVRAYQGTAAVGGTLSLLALVGPVPRQALPFGALMALVLWLTALYLLVQADGIAARRASRSS